MTSGVPGVAAMATAALTIAGLIQAAAGWLAVRRFRAAKQRPGPRPPISVLKPLYGDEPLLEEALATFCTQSYPCFQIVLGVQSPTDPAIAVVERLRARFPGVDMTLVVDPTKRGANRKVANLINMYPYARHSVLVVSDSDMHAPPDYLACVADALSVPGTGLVTTLYTGRPTLKPARPGTTKRRPALAGLLGSAYITQNFAAGALMARALGRQDCMGATMALTRDTLQRAGGFHALARYVADDAMLGRKIRDLGLRVSLARCVPATTVAERSLGALFRHELRWARTIRAVAPFGFAVSILQFPAFWGLATVLLTGGTPWALALWLVSIALRGTFGLSIERGMGSIRTPFWLPAIRDVLSMAVVLAAYLSDEVAWRGHVLKLDDDTHFSAARIQFAPRRG